MLEFFVPRLFLSRLGLVLCAGILCVLFSLTVGCQAVVLIVKSFIAHSEEGYFVNLIALQSCRRSYEVANPR